MADPGSQSKSNRTSEARSESASQAGSEPASEPNAQPSLETSDTRPRTRSEEERLRAASSPGIVHTLPEPGDLIDAKYRIDRLLAQGGMGAVYAATHVVSGKRAALKWMLPAVGQLADATERFIREARATARIDHPNVVDIYDVGSDGVSVYLVMELLQGETLHDRLTRAPMSPTQALALLMPALRGVAAAHEHGVIHRDLKPDNIFLCHGSDGEARDAKVVDFGISKISHSDHARDHGLTQTGVVMGTPYYMSPEQVRGVKEVDERGDIYAFGVILYEMLAGERPFQAETYNQLILKIATEDPEPITRRNPGVDPMLAAIATRAMARAPEARFPSIEALALALEPFAGGVTFRTQSYIPGALSAARASAVSGRLSSVPAVERSASRRASVAPSGRTWVLSGIALGLAATVAVFLYARTTAKTVPMTMHVLRAQAAELPAPPVPPTPPALALQPSAAAPDTTAPNTAFAPGAAPIAQPVTPRPANRIRRTTTAVKTSQTLPADWDERVRVAPTGKHTKASTSPSAAGRIRRDDLR